MAQCCLSRRPLLPVALVLLLLLLPPLPPATAQAPPAPVPEHYGWAGLRSAMAVVAPDHGLGPDFSTDATVVTCYFQLTKSKFTHTRYQAWLRQMLAHVKNPLVVFTTPADEPELRQMRGALPAVYITYPSLWDVPPAAHYRAMYQAQHGIDPERSIHSPELYAVWNSKVWFTAAAAAANPFRSRYFLWADAGSFRNRHFNTWPDPARLDAAFASCKAADCVLLGCVTARWQATTVDPAAHTPLVGDMVEGGFFAARAPSMLWLLTEFYSLLHEYASRGVFVGKDQTMFNMLAMKFYWRVAMLPAYRMTPGCGSDPWFAFQHMLAPPAETSNQCAMEVEAYHGNVTIALGPAR